MTLPPADDVRGSLDTHVSLETDDDGYVVIADLPGFETDEIDLQFHDGVLSIRAAHSEETTSDEGRAHSARSRQVSEQLRLPMAVRTEECTASYRNGVLEIHLPTEESVADEGTAIDISD